MHIPRNEIKSAITHYIGAGLAMAGLILLLVFSVMKESPWHVISFSIFGSFMVLLYISSAIYHTCFVHTKSKHVFWRIDHAMIYVFIAATYTPICFLQLRGAFGWTVFGVIWVLAIFGVIWKSCYLQLPKWFSLIFYLCMGWFALFILPFLSLSRTAILWLVAGGVFYTIGAVFFYIDTHLTQRLKYLSCHDVFHIFIIVGSFSHWYFFFYFL